MPPFLADIAPAWFVVAVGVIGLVYGFVVKVWPSISTAKDLRDDIMGEKPRPGVAARPGWGESIAMLTTSVADLTATLKDWQETSTAAQKRIEREMQETRAKVTSADYNSRPNGGKSAHDALMREILENRAQSAQALEAHVESSKEAHDELAQAIIIALEGNSAIGNLAEALPIIARSQPHDDDAA